MALKKILSKRARLIAVVMWGGLLSATSVMAADQILATVTNLALLGSIGSIVPSSWTTDMKATNTAIPYSWRTNVSNAEIGRAVYRLTMATNFPWVWTNSGVQKVDTVSLCSFTGWDYLSPETDEIRVRLKVVSGHFLLAAGGINLAFAPSDTYTDFRVLDESIDGWQTVRLSLNKNLIRNYRRNDFTKKLPYISLTRWIQEPIQLYLFRSGYGELLIDRVEFVATGLGHSYPSPTPAQITLVTNVADFESSNDMAQAFSYNTVFVNLAGPQPTNYTKVNQNTSGNIVVAGKSMQWFLPPRRAWVNQSTNGSYSLEVKQTGYESFAFTGLRLPNPDGANALLLTLRAENTNAAYTNLVIDFLAHATQPTNRAAFPWTNCQTPVAWMADTNLNFDLYLSESNTWKESYALYHLRRSVAKSQWTQIILPLADFAGIFACNKGTNLMIYAEPLCSTNLLFLGFFSPYRQLKAETRILIDDVSLVWVDLPTDQLKSFWQDPSVTNAQLFALTNYANYSGHFRQRDQSPSAMSLSANYVSNRFSVPVSGSTDQRYDIQASDDLKVWWSIFTGYIGSSEDPFSIRTNKAAGFFRTLSE
ncbi:MAG: hypothetical protein WCK57_02880 [Verrucomicrobiae bacterium]